MNVYDFDYTIFNGDSTMRFTVFCVARKPAILRRLPGIVWGAVLLALGRTDKTGFKARLFSYLEDFDHIENVVEDFWAENRGRIQAWYLARKKPDDLVISAGPEFLLKPVCPRLIASRVDPKTGRYTGINCDGKEKVARFRERYPDAAVAEFYSDSLSDTPMAQEAEKAYLVKRGRIHPWPL